MSKRKYLTKSECADKGWFSKPDLKLERLKPAPDQLPVDVYWQGHGLVYVYDKSQCVAMQPYRKPTQKQAEALERGRGLLGTVKCKTDGCSGRVYNWSDDELCKKCIMKEHLIRKQAITASAVFLDTETTGLDSFDQVIEIAVVDWKGNVLIDQRIRPTVEIEPEARAVHGISKFDLHSCPEWADIADKVKEVLKGRQVVIFNADFDKRLLMQTAAAFNQDTEWIEKLDTHCAMYIAAGEYGATNKYGTISLKNAANEASIKWQGEAHSALGDALTTLKLVQKMCG